MHIYSNNLLSVQTVRQIIEANSLYPGKCDDYDVYCIKNLTPLEFTTSSSLSRLSENRTYYCYSQEFRDQYYEIYGNQYDSENNAWIPKSSIHGDLIIIFR
jgi:hypothetical protein